MKTRKQKQLVTGAMLVGVGLAAFAQEKTTTPTTPATGATATTTASVKTEPWIRLEGTDLHLGSLPPVALHGFVSQGFLVSDDYNYLGDTTRGSFLFTEAGFNVAFNPFPRTRISAQVFTFDVGQDVGKYDVVLDYAQAEYTFCDAIGIRGGRIRRPQGIYNHIQDMDLARTSVLLPQGMYDARFRDFYATLDGGSLFGAVPLGKGGSLSYEAYGGMISPSMDGGMAKVFYNTVPSIVRLDAIEPMPTVGAQIWWNTPADGLRIGGSVFYGSAIELRTTTLGLIQNMELLDFTMFQGSVEYSWKSWTFQGEYMARSQHTHGGATINGDSWYVGASRRFSKWFEAGVYYTEYYGDVTQRENSLQYQKDAALSLRFDVADWWIMKVEGHCIRGTGLLFDNATNPVQNNDTWFMLALKTTFCF